MISPENLAEDHWNYIKKLLEAHGENSRTVSLIGFHYKSAMIHGFGHCKEEMKNE